MFLRRSHEVNVYVLDARRITQIPFRDTHYVSGRGKKQIQEVLTSRFELQPPAPSFQDHLLQGILFQNSRILKSHRRSSTFVGGGGMAND